MGNQVIKMNQTIKISVIIPVYNTKYYLRECFDSVLNQSLSDLELFIVDDGSDDGGWEIIEEYTAKFSNVFSFQQDRKRQGAARNLALQHARGEFVAFADSDDTIPNNAYELMYNLAIKNSADMTIGILRSFNKKIAWLGVPVHENEFIKIKDVTNIFEFPELLTDISPCNRLIRRSSIDKYQIKFSEKMSGEDLDFMARLFLRVERISILPEVVYNYRARTDASTKRVEYAFFRDRVEVTQNLKQYFSEYGGDSIFSYLLRSEARKLVRNRLPRSVKELQYDELVQVLDTIHILAEQLTEDDILRSNDFPLIGQIRIIFIKYKQYDALIAYEKQPTTAKFQSLITDDECQRLLFNPLLGYYRSKIKNLTRISRKGLGYRSLIKRKLNTSKKLALAVNTQNLSKLYALVKYFLLYPISWINNFRLVRQGIWLVDERVSQSAEDNSYHLFCYLRKNYPELPVYFVISKFSKHRKMVESLGNVVVLFSWKHFLLLNQAKVLISTDNFRMLAFPYEIFPKLRKKTLNVFLQHGVAAIKRFTYTKKRYPYFNHVIVSSDNEKNILVKECGFSFDEVFVTGLARFDNLEINHPFNNKKQKILLMPTWRKWLKNAAAVNSSKYLHIWKSLLLNSKLNSILEQYNAELYFRPHFNMLPFFNDFDVSSVDIQIVNDSELTVQLLVKQCDLIITDYSSVLFDFLYQNKPAISYIFDDKEMEYVHGKPYVDYDSLPISIARTEDELLNKVIYNLDNNCQIDESIKPEIDQFIKYRDHNNCERIYHSIIQTVEEVKHDQTN